MFLNDMNNYLLSPILIFLNVRLSLLICTHFHPKHIHHLLPILIFRSVHYLLLWNKSYYSKDNLFILPILKFTNFHFVSQIGIPFHPKYIRSLSPILFLLHVQRMQLDYTHFYSKDIQF
jgi:hypothetical protein